MPDAPRTRGDSMETSGRRRGGVLRDSRKPSRRHRKLRGRTRSFAGKELANRMSFVQRPDVTDVPKCEVGFGRDEPRHPVALRAVSGWVWYRLSHPTWASSAENDRQQRPSVSGVYQTQLQTALTLDRVHPNRFHWNARIRAGNRFDQSLPCNTPVVFRNDIRVICVPKKARFIYQGSNRTRQLP